MQSPCFQDGDKLILWFPQEVQFWGYMWCPWTESIDNCWSADLTYITQGVKIGATFNMASSWLESLRVSNSVKIITFSLYFFGGKINCLKAVNETYLVCLFTNWMIFVHTWNSYVIAMGMGWGRHWSVLAFAWEKQEIGPYLAVSWGSLQGCFWKKIIINVSPHNYTSLRWRYFFLHVR